MAGFGKEIASKVLGTPTAEFGAYAAGKIIPGKRKLKTDFIPKDDVSTLQKWTKQHIEKGSVTVDETTGKKSTLPATSDFSSYAFAPGTYNDRMRAEGKDTVHARDISIKDAMYSKSYGLMNTIGGGKLTKDEGGNLFMYDDYVFGERGGESEISAKGFMDKLIPGFSDKWGGTAKIENIARKFLGTNKGAVQYGGYRGENPNAQPQIQRIGNISEMGLSEDQVSGLDSVKDYVPDIERYYTGEGERRGALGRKLYDRRVKKEKGDWYAGKFAGQATKEVGDFLESGAKGAGKLATGTVGVAADALGSIGNRLGRFLGGIKEIMTPVDQGEPFGRKERIQAREKREGTNQPPELPWDDKGKKKPGKNLTAVFDKDQPSKKSSKKKDPEETKVKLKSKMKKITEPFNKKGASSKKMSKKERKMGSKERADYYKKRGWKMDDTISKEFGGTWGKGK